ncbi:MAG: nucleotidyl transferase AbiEii/AbiGii toxin family protein [Patescibacteria group bacterium]
MFNTNLHKTIMVKILKEIYSDLSLGPILGFKGGTLVYLLYNLPRFSVDLDFDLLQEGKEDYVLEKIGLVLEKFGTLREKRNKHFTLFSLLSYGTSERQLKVEISKRSIDSKYELKNYLGIPILAMEKKDIYANKLAALLGRKEIANRDIFDIWYFAKEAWPINYKLVEERTGLRFDKYIWKCIKILEKMPERHILSGMGELLDSKLKIWAKDNLKKETIFQLKLLLESLKK